MALVLVSREAHANKHFKPVRSFEFARSFSVVRIVAGEAPLVAQNFPIAFVAEQDGMAPVAVLGLAKNENLFVSETGTWLGGYVPAFLRRYPFHMGKQTNPSSAEQGNLAVMIDDAFLSDSEGELLFGPPDQAEPKGPLAKAIQLLTEIAIQDKRTSSSCTALSKEGVFESLSLQVTRGNNAPEIMTGLHRINETKLNALADEQFLALRRADALGLAYAHFISLGQFARLRGFADARAAKTT